MGRWSGTRRGMSAMLTRFALMGAWLGRSPGRVGRCTSQRGGSRRRKSRGSRAGFVSLVDSPARLYPVGRLDADSTGLLLLTNDGELANRLTHPRYEVPKTYLARVGRAVPE